MTEPMTRFTNWGLKLEDTDPDSQAYFVLFSDYKLLREQLAQARTECREIGRIENERAVETMRLKRELEQAQRENRQYKRWCEETPSASLWKDHDAFKAQLAQQAKRIEELELQVRHLVKAGGYHSTI